MAGRVLTFGPSSQGRGFPIPQQPRQRSGFQIGGDDNGNDTLELLALLQFLSSQESQQRGDLLERRRFESQEDRFATERREELRARGVARTTNTVKLLEDKKQRLRENFGRDQDKRTRAGGDSLKAIARRADELFRRRGTSLNNDKIDKFLAEELPAKVAAIINSTTDPTRLGGIRAELGRILSMFEGTTQTSSEAIRIHTEETFRELNRAHSPERQLERFNDAVNAFQKSAAQFTSSGRETIQELLRRHDTDPKGTPRSSVTREFDQLRDFPEDIFPRIAAPDQDARGGFGPSGPAAPLVKQEQTFINRTEGLLPPILRELEKTAEFGQQNPLLTALTELPAELLSPGSGFLVTQARRHLAPILLGDPGTAVGLPTPQDLDLIRVEQEITGLSNEFNTAQDPSTAPPVQLIESQSQEQAGLSLDDLFRMADFAQPIPGMAPLRHGVSPIEPFGPVGVR